LSTSLSLPLILLYYHPYCSRIISWHTAPSKHLLLRVHDTCFSFRLVRMRVAFGWRASSSCRTNFSLKHRFFISSPTLESPRRGYGRDPRGDGDRDFSASRSRIAQRPDRRSSSPRKVSISDQSGSALCGRLLDGVHLESNDGAFLLSPNHSFPTVSERSQRVNFFYVLPGEGECEKREVERSKVADESPDSRLQGD
jgi:hypothetical protein